MVVLLRVRFARLSLFFLWAWGTIAPFGCAAFVFTCDVFAGFAVQEVPKDFVSELTPYQLEGHAVYSKILADYRFRFLVGALRRLCVSVVMAAA